MILFAVIGFLEILVMVLIVSPLCLPEGPIARLEIVSIGVLSFFAQIAFVVAAQYENAASVALLRNAFNVIFAFLFQIVVFQVRKFHLLRFESFFLIFHF